MGGDSPVLAGKVAVCLTVIGAGTSMTTDGKTLTGETGTVDTGDLKVVPVPAVISHLQSLVPFFVGNGFLGRQQLFLVALTPQ